MIGYSREDEAIELQLLTSMSDANFRGIIVTPVGPNNQVFEKFIDRNVRVSYLSQTGAGQLTQRQILILRGMVEGKTNHELATEMGFSVSTIRHETMRIYQALSVSDRKEAAKKAIMLSLV